MEGKGNVICSFLKKQLFFPVGCHSFGDGNRHHAVCLVLIFQPDAHGRPVPIMLRQGAIPAGFKRIIKRQDT